MLNKNCLSGVLELKLAGKINNMNDSQFSEYINSLNIFIDKFPSYVNKLRTNFDLRNYTAVSACLSEVCGVLNDIYADDIAREYRGKISKISSADRDTAEVIVENFIQRVSALSIDIQMAIHSNAGSPPARSSEWSSERPTILAVDNAVMFLNTMKKLLRNEPYNLHCTTSCDEALRFCSEERPDIILLDIEMPEMDGYSLAKRIKSAGQKAPIIFITANSAREYVDKAIEAGAVGLLVKPLRISQLLEKLKTYS